MTRAEAIKFVDESTTLDMLRCRLRRIERECDEARADDRLADSFDDLVDMSDLPTFGGAAPKSTTGIWSWDEDRLLVGEGIDELEIVPRTVAAEED